MLVPHPDFPNAAIRSITVDVEEVDRRGLLSLTYRVVSVVDAVLWPLPSRGGRADGLWEHSCFEAFVGRPGEEGYTELNLATSGQWAVYDFDRYRTGMRDVADMSFALGVGFGADGIELSAATHLPVLRRGREWELGLSAIIEAKDGSKSYWALSHAPGPPDFHNRDCFTARLAAPNAP
ncbi:MAG: DOMON-like domain-containing protein [Sphingomonas sp.]